MTATKTDVPVTPTEQVVPISGSEILITPAGFRALRERVARLREAGSRELSERMRDARDYGETSNNDEYLAILEDDAVLDSQLARLEELLSRARVVDEAAVKAGSVGVGSTVAVEDLRSHGIERYRVVGSLEATGAGIVTAGSPVGEALLGRKAEDLVTVTLPNGRTRELRVVAVEMPDSADVRQR